MMESTYRIKIAIVFLLAYLSACSPPDEKDERPSEYDVSIAYLKSLYSGHPVDITTDYRIKGYVIATDDFGNFYKTIVIADDTGGIEIKVDMEEIFIHFWFCHEVSVYCNGLTLGAYSDLVQLGTAAADGYETGYIGENIITAHLQITGRATEAPQAFRLAIDELSERYLSCLVRFDDVQFVDEERGLLWCDPDADTDRHIVDRTGNILTVRTSRHAECASWLLPHGNGYIEGILSYFNGEYQLRMADPRMLEMNGERF